MNASCRPKPVVVVPVHRPYPTADEQFGLKRCGTLLGSYPISIVHPAGLDLDPYLKLLPAATPFPVSPSWMASVRAYNRMMANPAFYRNFRSFSHILIHEPDALVLSDQLIYWCEQPYDYIGAPWFKGFTAAGPHAPFAGVGNSGFSLINVSAIYRFFSSDVRWFGRTAIAKEFLKKIFRRPSVYPVRFLFQALGPAGIMSGAHTALIVNFDYFIAAQLSNISRLKLDIPHPEVAMHFSWEVNPSRCFALCGNVPPFGIHAWARYDRKFVESILSSLA